MKEESQRTQLIQDCRSIEQLKGVIDILEEVEGSRNIIYTSEKIKERIGLIETNLSNGIPYTSIEWNIITRTHGLRAKCMELFYYETY